jgi:hypothetical protein
LTEQALDHQSTYTAQACPVVASPFTDANTAVYEMYLGPDDTLQVSALVDSAKNVVVKSDVAAVPTVLKGLLEHEAKLMHSEARLIHYGEYIDIRMRNAQASIYLYMVEIVDRYKEIAPKYESRLQVSAAADFFGAVIGSVRYDHGECMAFLVLQYFFPTKQFSLVLHVLVDKRTPCQRFITVEAYKEMMLHAASWVKNHLSRIGMPYISLGAYLMNNEIRFGPSTNEYFVLPILGKYKPAKNVMPSSPWPANPRVCAVCGVAPAVVVTSCKHQLMCIDCTEKLTDMRCPVCRAAILEWWVAPPVLE